MPNSTGGDANVRWLKSSENDVPCGAGVFADTGPRLWIHCTITLNLHSKLSASLAQDSSNN
jgi:hypothetical protein